MGEIEVHALRGVSLAVDRGDFVAIMGASGSGKSTLMNILGCLDLPTRGRYLLDGVDVRRPRRRRARRRPQPQDRLRLPELQPHPADTARSRNVELPLIYAGLKRRRAPRTRRAALEAVGLAIGSTTCRPSCPAASSSGSRSPGRSSRDPAIILADEPTGNLDTESTREVLDIFSPA